MLSYWDISRLIGTSRMVYACSTFLALLGPPSQPRVPFCDKHFEFRAQLKFHKHYATPHIKSFPSIYTCHVFASMFGTTAWPRLAFHEKSPGFRTQLLFTTPYRVRGIESFPTIYTCLRLDVTPGVQSQQDALRLALDALRETDSV